MNNSLDIVNTEDEEFKEHYNELMLKIKKKKLEEYEPNITEINKVYEVIVNFIKEKKRKIYGGYALDKLLVQKNKGYALYDELDTPDIDFYSPEPLDDLLELCDRLFKAGLKDVAGQEAQHKETYSIFVNHVGPYCDISYMPNNIYSHTRFIQIDGFNVVHPWFMMIDYYRMFTDPINSYWRLEKHFARYLKLQKTYPLPLISKPLKISPYSNDDITIAMNKLFDFIAEKETTLLTGFYAYNYYLYISEYYKANKNYEYIYMPYLEAYSTNYINDGIELIEFIKTLPEDISSKLTYTENYPFTQFYGYNVVIYFNDGKDKIPILYLYSNNKKCLPYKEVEYIKFDNLNKNKPIKIKSMSLKIASFDFNILHSLIILVKVRIDEDNDWNDTLYKLINGYVCFRKYYFKKNNLSIYDDSIFQSFVINCIGETISHDRESRLVKKSRKKLGKPLVYRYDPEQGKRPGKYIFLNSSGNAINKDINLRLVEKNKNKNIQDEFDDEEKDNDNDNESVSSQSTNTSRISENNSKKNESDKSDKSDESDESDELDSNIF